MLVFIMFYSVVYLSNCQRNQNQLHSHPQPFSLAGRGFTPPSSHRRLQNTVVVNALPAAMLIRPLQKTHPELLEAKASETISFKNGASMFAGKMSTEFLKEMSDYIYGLISGKLSTLQHRARSRTLRRGRQSNEVLDYEDEARARDAAERTMTQHRSLAVVQAASRAAIPLSVRSKTWAGISRRKPTNDLRISEPRSRSNSRFSSGRVV